MQKPAEKAWFDTIINLSSLIVSLVVRTSPSQAQVDQFEGCLLEKPIPYISNDNFSQEVIFDYWNDNLSGHTHVKWTHPDVVRKQYDDLKKNTMDKTLENTLKTGMNTKLPTCDDKGWWRHIQETEVVYGG
jgi:hypothetical protein